MVRIITILIHPKIFEYENNAVSKTKNNYYYFIFGYIDSTSYKINLYYYRIDIISQSLSCQSSITNYGNIEIVSTGVSFEFVLYKGNEYIFCFYETYRSKWLIGWDYDIFFDFFQFNQNPITSLETIEHDHLDLKYIRSASKSIDSYIFYCGIKADGTSKCLISDFEYDESEYIFDEGNEEKCIIAPYNVKTYYFLDTDEYVFSCLTENYKIQTTIYNKNMNTISDIKNPSMRLLRFCEGCNNEFYYSIIYNKVKRKYYIISDIDCGIYGKFFPLIEGDVDEEQEEKKENEREIIKENEENKIKQEKESEKETKNKEIPSEKEEEKEIDKEKEIGKQIERVNEIEKEKKKDLENEHEKNEQNENEKDKGKEIEEKKKKKKRIEKKKKMRKENML